MSPFDPPVFESLKSVVRTDTAQASGAVRAKMTIPSAGWSSCFEIGKLPWFRTDLLGGVSPSLLII
jgi:hypothetical protein